MPCDRVYTINVDLSSLGRIDADVLAAALNDLHLGANVRNGQDGKAELVRFGSGEWINVRTGQTQLNRLRDQNEIKRSYSRQVVISQCKRYGWAYKETEQGQFVVTKR